MHSLHAQETLIGVRQCGKPHEGTADIAVDLLCQGLYHVRHALPCGAASDIDIGALRFADQLYRPVDGLLRSLFLLRIGHHLRRDVLSHGGLDVLGDIHQYHAGPPGFCQLEGLPDGVRQLVYIGHKIIMLGYGEGDSRDIDLLEAVLSDERGGNISRNGHHGDGIQHSRGDARYQVRGSRS